MREGGAGGGGGCILKHISMKPLKVNNILFYVDQDIEITTF